MQENWLFLYHRFVTTIDTSLSLESFFASIFFRFIPKLFIIFGSILFWFLNRLVIFPRKIPLVAICNAYFMFCFPA